MLSAAYCVHLESRLYVSLKLVVCVSTVTATRYKCKVGCHCQSQPVRCSKKKGGASLKCQALWVMQYWVQRGLVHVDSDNPHVLCRMTCLEGNCPSNFGYVVAVSHSQSSIFKSDL